MKSTTTQAKETESSYLGAIAANLKAQGSRFIAGSWFNRDEHDRGETLRAAMADRRKYDRDLYSGLPHGRGFTVRGYERRWIFGRRLKSATIATVLVPPGPMLDSPDSIPPVTRSQVMEHVQSLITDPKVPHVIGICSPSGFDNDVYNTPPTLANVKLVFVEPRDNGGWRVTPSDKQLDARLCKLFDPEDAAAKLSRVRRAVEEQSSDLLTGSISAASLSRKLDLPPALVSQAIENMTRADSSLRVSKRDGDVTLYRTSSYNSPKEDSSMSLAEWIKSLFSKEGEEMKKISVLSERRAALSSQLDRLYVDVGQLEKREQQLVDEGKAAASKVGKLRIVAQIDRLRKDLSRTNTAASILSKQINIISTHIHNLELARTGSFAQLPTSDELTQAAVNAEEILEELSASDELVSGLEVGLAEASISDDQAAILKELEEKEESAQVKQPSGKERSTDSATTKDKNGRERGPAQAE